MPNRLADETSPYLLQHQNNPVDWYPWGPEAFEKAQREDKPIFLSIGYSSCHWCHVMEHESFEDAEVAESLNANFVCIKVDREERPDIDEAYMAFVQMTSGRGGWPMSVFLTPDKRPFFGGTYWPKENRGQYAGFLSLTKQLGQTWKLKRKEVDEAAAQYAQVLREARSGKAPGTFTQLSHQFIDDAVTAQLSGFDRSNGGFGEAPKFPPHSALAFLFDYALSEAGDEKLRQAALGVSLLTLQRMALGGIHDHVGGGFHRYSTDAEWLLPHFEKMLYDNALLLANYARGAAVAHEVEPELGQLFGRAASGIVSWLQREMTAPEGFFFSALDADSEGEEGAYYVWSLDEVAGLPNGENFAKAYGFDPEGNFVDEATRQKTGKNIPNLIQDVAGAYDETLDALLARRQNRPRPALDDKALVGWNGLMIGALAEAGVPSLAERAAEAILAVEAEHGALPHQIAKGKASGEAFLEDYAFFADGLLKLAQVKEMIRSQTAQGPNPQAMGGRSPVELAQAAQRLAIQMVEKFYDAERGGFWGTSEGHEELFGRTKPVFDQPVPSGNAVALQLLAALGDRDRVQQSIEGFIGWLEKAPTATESLYQVALLLVGPRDAEAAAAPVVINQEVTVKLDRKELPADASGKAQFKIEFSVPEGLHLNTNDPPARWLTPTRLEIRPLKHTIDYPAGSDHGYDGDFAIPFTVELPAGESGAEFEVKVTFQPCTESECLLAVEKTFSGVVYRA